MKRNVTCIALLLSACGGESVADRIDALQRTGTRYVHDVMKPAGTDSAPTPARGGLDARFRDSAHGRALLDAGAEAVPDLVRLLDDPVRRTLAAAVLAEIGGTDAAEALLGEWRKMRALARRTCMRRVPDAGASIGNRYENVDGEFYAELIDALCRTGPAVSASITLDTEEALQQSERLRAAGTDLVLREIRREEGRLLEFRWSPEPIETACEGLRVLAAIGAPEAPALMAQALRMQVRALRATALRCLVLLGERAEPLLPDVARLLEDPEWRDEARLQLAILSDSLTEDQRLAMARGLDERTRGQRGEVR